MTAVEVRGADGGAMDYDRFQELKTVVQAENPSLSNFQVADRALGRLAAEQFQMGTEAITTEGE